MYGGGVYGVKLHLHPKNISREAAPITTTLVAARRHKLQLLRAHQPVRSSRRPPPLKQAHLLKVVGGGTMSADGGRIARWQ